MKVEKNIQTIQNDKEWQLPEPTTLMSAKAYKDKKAEPLVTRLKEVLQTVMINNLDLNRKLESAGKRLDQIRQQNKASGKPFGICGAGKWVVKGRKQ